MISYNVVREVTLSSVPLQNFIYNFFCFNCEPGSSYN